MSDRRIFANEYSNFELWKKAILRWDLCQFCPSSASCLRAFPWDGAGHGWRGRAACFPHGKGVQPCHIVHLLLIYLFAFPVQCIRKWGCLVSAQYCQLGLWRKNKTNFCKTAMTNATKVTQWKLGQTELKDKTLPKALRTPALTALTGKFGLLGVIWFVRFGFVGLVW